MVTLWRKEGSGTVQSDLGSKEKSKEKSKILWTAYHLFDTLSLHISYSLKRKRLWLLAVAVAVVHILIAEAYLENAGQDDLLLRVMYEIFAAKMLLAILLTIW